MIQSSCKYDNATRKKCDDKIKITHMTIMLHKCDVMLIKHGSISNKLGCILNKHDSILNKRDSYVKQI